MRRASSLLFAAFVVSTFACGSVNTDDLFGKTSGAGTGGSATTSTSDSTSVSTTASVTVASSVVASSSTGPMMCDATVACSECRACVAANACHDAAVACDTTKDCGEYIACANKCGGGDAGCYMQCASAHMLGFGIAKALSCCVQTNCQHCASPYQCM